MDAYKLIALIISVAGLVVSMTANNYYVVGVVLVAALLLILATIISEQIKKGREKEERDEKFKKDTVKELIELKDKFKTHDKLSKLEAKVELLFNTYVREAIPR